MEDDSQSDPGSSVGGPMPAAVFDISRKGLNALAVSPDGTRLATAARDGVVRIHELTTGALLSGFRVSLTSSSCSDFRVAGHRWEERELSRQVPRDQMMGIFPALSRNGLEHPIAVCSKASACRFPLCTGPVVLPDNTAV